MPLAAVAGISAGTSLISGLLGSNAASNAASEQAQAAEQAAQLQYQASQNALGFQEQQYNTGQAELQPWLQSGTGAVSNLDYLMGVSPQSAFGPTQAAGQPSAIGSPAIANPARSTQISGVHLPSDTKNPLTPASSASEVPGSGVAGSIAPAAPFTANPSSASPGGYGSLLAPYSGHFTAPTAQEAMASPAEQAQLKIGNQQLQQSAAAQGNLLTGGTLQALQNYGENVAAQNYQNVYNNALNTYSTGYNQYANQQNNEFNRLSALAGGGQTAANQLGTLGASTANSVANNVMGTASQMGQDTQNAAYQNASGIINSANAWTGALGNTGSNLTQLALLNQLYGSGSGGANLSSLDVGNAINAGLGMS